MTVTIRRATRGDARVLARLNGPIQALHAAAQPYLFKPAAMTPELVAHFDAELARPELVAFIADADDEPVGYAVAAVVERPDNPFTYAFRYLLLDALSVNPEHRRRGIGTALVAAVLGLAREQGISHVWLNVYDFNQEALAFYTRQGFRSLHYRLEIDLSAAEDIDAMG
jgi:ribosomal protein S18 acetylase RimI-like enzyme